MKLLAPAKINLGLSIEKKLADGYHQVSLVNCQVSLFDEIILKKSGRTNLPFGPKNTIVETLALLKQNPAVSLIKKIPIGCGLGGSSSDAAAILKYFRRTDLVPKIGMDVPYACLGGVRREEQGDLSGSKFEVLPDLPKCFFVVCVPDKRISTAWAYAQMDKKKFKPVSLEVLVKAIKAKDLQEIGKNLVNDFERLAKRVCPEIEVIQKRLLVSGALGVSISGKGPATFGIFKTKNLANLTMLNLQRQFPQSYLVQPLKEAYVYQR